MQVARLRPGGQEPLVGFRMQDRHAVVGQHVLDVGQTGPQVAETKYGQAIGGLLDDLLELVALYLKTARLALGGQPFQGAGGLTQPGGDL